MRVATWPDPFPKGWDGAPENLNGLGLWPQISLEDALGAQYSTDAHAVPYVVCDEDELLEAAPRIRKIAVKPLEAAGLSVQLETLWLDVDCPADLKDRPDMITAWYAEQRAVLGSLGFVYHYRTRHGYRLIWRLDRPATPDEYETINERWRLEIRRVTGGLVQPDDRCSDWTRCYRLPWVVRSGQREQWTVEPGTDPIVLSVGDLLGASTVRKFSGLESAEERSGVTVGETIDHGGRAVTLFRLGCALRNHGLSEAAIHAALSVMNEERCSPPLDAGEVLHAAQGAARYEVGPLPIADPRDGRGVVLQLGTEAEIAERLLEVLEEDGPPVVFDRGLLWFYSDGIWSPLRQGEIAQAVIELDGASVGKKNRLRVGEATCRHVATLFEYLRDSPGFFDGRVPGVAFRGGVVVRIEDGRIVVDKPSPDHRLTHAMDLEWNPSAEAPTLLGVLKRAFAGCPDYRERIDLLAEFAGACLTGQASVYQKALLLVGEGANGKSTVLDAISALFPPGSRTAIPPQLFADSYHKAELAGALLNVVAEVPETDIIAAEAFRAIVDGSEITARRIRQEPFAFTPRAGHLWACNNLPGSRDFSHAFWRRWIAVNFPNTIPEDEQDRGIGARIRAELDGVARWALEGAARLARRGHYSIPSSSKVTLRRWRKGADQVARFAEESLEPASSERLASSRIYQRYKVWAAENGNKALSSHKFSERLKKLGFSKTRTAEGRFFGVRFKPRGVAWAN